MIRCLITKEFGAYSALGYVVINMVSGYRVWSLVELTVLLYSSWEFRQKSPIILLLVTRPTPSEGPDPKICMTFFCLPGSYKLLSSANCYDIISKTWKNCFGILLCSATYVPCSVSQFHMYVSQTSEVVCAHMYHGVCHSFTCTCRRPLKSCVHTCTMECVTVSHVRVTDLWSRVCTHVPWSVSQFHMYVSQTSEVVFAHMYHGVCHSFTCMCHRPLKSCVHTCTMECVTVSHVCVTDLWSRVCTHVPWSVSHVRVTDLWSRVCTHVPWSVSQFHMYVSQTSEVVCAHAACWFFNEMFEKGARITVFNNEVSRLKIKQRTLKKRVALLWRSFFGRKSKVVWNPLLSLRQSNLQLDNTAHPTPVSPT